MPRDVPHVFHL